MPPANAAPPSRRGRWRTILYLATLLVSLPVLGISAWRCAHFYNFQSGFFQSGFPGFFETEPRTGIEDALNPAQRLLLVGNNKATNLADRWKPLWDSEPDNPAYLAEYAMAFLTTVVRFSRA